MKIDQVLSLEGLALREIILRSLSDPNTALAIAVLGMFLIYWELLRPGAVMPGASGGVLFLLGIYSVTVTWSSRRPEIWLTVSLLLPWGVVTALLLTVGRRARRNKSVEHLSGSLRN